MNTASKLDFNLFNSIFLIISLFGKISNAVALEKQVPLLVISLFL